ncbi:DUF3794 domain-containing protein [Bacillus sp. IB182487]|uniref:DUF3794 domain-containing protein n=2 Tax=Metabacillus arenae TaxID=2771434 RepID=A0A926RYD3_9BACI|nr:DUF3794 domain-containing protein [Metabacillus arenae]
MKKNKKCISFNKSASIEQCDSTPRPTTGISNAVINAPVILATLRVSTNLVANIHFPDPVLEIKDIKKRLKIVQCRLLLPTNQLFLKGFVRKNIQYATPCPGASDSCVSSNLRSLTVDVPWECVTSIDPDDFDTPPIDPRTNTSEEFDFFRAQDLGDGFPEKDQLLSSDLSQFHQISTQFYNQLPFCELLRSRIVEWDESTDREPLPDHGPFEEGIFHNLVEKMFLRFDIRILQNQPVAVGDNGNNG